MTKTNIIILICGSVFFYIVSASVEDNFHLKAIFKKNLKDLKEYYKENIK